MSLTRIKFHSLYIVIATLLLTIQQPVRAMTFIQLFPADSTQVDSVYNQPYRKSKQPTFRQTDRFGDPFSNPQRSSPLLLQDPSSLQLDLKIDADMNYTIYERIGTLSYRPISTMSFQEFNRFQDQQMKKKYWKNKSAGLDGESAISAKRIIPKLYISPVFDRVFGGSYIDLIPNGFVNLDFGGRWQRIQNPAIPVNQQKNGNFNFNQQISLNLVGKVGEKLAVTANFDNNSSFDIQNNMKVEYTGYAEDIIKKIELGNVSMSVANSLMTGGQSLFGIKTQLQFGKLYVTAIASRQQSSVENLSSNRNSTGLDFAGSKSSGVGKFDFKATDYDEDRHFFLSHFFRNHYEAWLARLPQIISGLKVIRLEVYVMNTSQETATLRNVAAFLDLAESDTLQNKVWEITPSFVDGVADNRANELWNSIKDNSVLRSKTTIDDNIPGGMSKNIDYEVLQARKLESREYTWNDRLGYLSLQRKLNSNQFLAVAYQYSYHGQTYTVGELSDEYSGKPDDYLVFLKMLKPSNTNTDLTSWDLAMKNIYSLPGRTMQQDGFELRINYRDDTKNYNAPNLNEGTNTTNTPLIEVLGLDQLNITGDNQKDGKFDYINNVTVDENNGNIIFPVLEPFGSHLKSKFTDNEQPLKDKYVFHELYDNTKTIAKTISKKDKFFIYGNNPSSSTSEISLPGINIERGSVVVLNGSEALIENKDYRVDYNTGKVILLRSDIDSENLDIKYEKQDLFSGIRSKWLTGIRLDYQFSDKINLGATVFHVSERARGISRFAIGQEPIKNTKYGFDANYDQPSRVLTKVIDALPLLSTKEESRVRISGEFAHLLPGTSNDVNGESTSYIEDFESTVTKFNIAGGHLPWKLGSVPVPFLTGEGIASGNKRAKIAWYQIDRNFYVASSRPSNLGSDDQVEGHYVKQILQQDIFKQKDPQQTGFNALPIFDLAYYPNQRGPYNYNNSVTEINTEGEFIAPEDNFAAITRANTGEIDFTKNNIEYIEFWMLDPFISGAKGRQQVTGEQMDVVDNEHGELVFNFGLISEDVLPDNQYEYENGLPADGSDKETIKTPWGRVTTTDPLTDFFVNTNAARINQDVGIDGINSSQEKDLFIDNNWFDRNNYSATAYAKLAKDPASDDFEYFFSDNHDNNNANVLQRYKNFNGYEGNSPISAGSNSYTASSTSKPDKEDVVEDRIINNVDAYREFRIKLNKGMDIGDGYIVDKVADSQNANWFLFRIPFNSQEARDIGNYKITNNKMIRIYLTGWKKPVVLRMANLDMVSSQWRKSTENLAEKGFDIVPEPSTSGFEISVVNIEANGNTTGGKPPYILPPGITRDQDNSTAVVRQINEQSLKVSVKDLEDGNSKGVFKIMQKSLINYDNIKMFFHGEQLDELHPIQDDDINVFLRMGADQSDNYYQIELPLKITPHKQPAYTAEAVWPSANEIDLSFQKLIELKNTRNELGESVLKPFSTQSGKYKLTILGNPKLVNIVNMMIGITNPKTAEDIDKKSVVIWANEIRVTGYSISDGWAANANVNVTLADFANLKGSVRYQSAGFGSIQDNVTKLGTDNFLDYNLSMDVAIDKLIPWKTGIKIPMRVGYAKKTITPTLDPLQNDLPLSATLSQIQDTKERENYKEMVNSSTVNKSISFSNVHKEKLKKDAKNHIYDIENLSFGYTYTESRNKNITTEKDIRKNYTGNISYSYTPKAKPFQPFKKVKALAGNYLKWLKDFNISFLPSNISVNAVVNRSYQIVQKRNADLTIVGIAPNFQKSFTFNRNYNLRWNIFKSINLNYSAKVGTVIDEPEGDIDTQAKKDSIWNNIKRLGRIKRFNQTAGFTYRLPLNKIPLTSWINADYKYNVQYAWTGGNLAQLTDFGNVINNNRTQNLTGKFNFLNLYNKSKYLKSINSPTRSRSNSTHARVPATNADTTKNNVPVLKGLLRLVMSIQSINVTMGKRETTILPGFASTPYLFGMSEGFNAPGAAFVFGDQNPSIKTLASNNHWLVKNANQTESFSQTLTNDLSISASIEPLKNVRIQVNMKRTDQNKYSELYQWHELTSSFQSLTPLRSGSYSISFLPIRTAFIQTNTDNSSDVFTTFEKNIEIITARLQAQGKEYNENAQETLIPALIAAYTGANAETTNLSPIPKIPLPNWRISYGGLSKLPLFKEIFSSVNITHAYSSLFKINNYSSNPIYTDAAMLDLSNSILDYPLGTLPGSTGKLKSVYIISDVAIVEQFSPLIGISIRTKSKITSKIAWKKSRNLNFNIANSQLTEQKSDDVSFDFGMTKKNMKIPFKIQGRTISLENDIQFRMTFTIKKTTTIQRKINDVQTLTAGNLGYQLKPTVTYVANQKLNISMYYEYNVNQPQISSAFNRTASAFGVQIRFSLIQ